MSGEYRPRTHLNKVLAASFSTHSERHILLCLCWRAEFDRPEVTITKRQIAAMTGLSVGHIAASLRSLESEGSITVIRNRFGGRSRAPTYRLSPAKGSDNIAKGSDNRTPSKDSKYSMSADAARQPESSAAGRGASRQKNAGYKRGGGGGKRRNFAEKQQSGAGEALSPEKETKVRRRALALKLTGDWGLANELIAKWDSGEKSEGQP